MKDLIRAFLFELHDRVIESGFYDRVTRRPGAQACVEVACGLEGLADAYAIATSSQDQRTGDYRDYILTALAFLMRAQRPDNRVCLVALDGREPVQHIISGAGAHGVALSRDGAYAFITNTVANTVTMIDVERAKAVRSWPAGKAPNGVVAF